MFVDVAVYVQLELGHGGCKHADSVMMIMSDSECQCAAWPAVTSLGVPVALGPGPTGIYVQVYLSPLELDCQ